MNLYIVAIICIGLLVFFVLFSYQGVMFWQKISVASHPLFVNIVAAGDVKRGTPQRRPLILDLDNSEQNAELKSILEGEKYSRYLVSGYSMLLANIHTNDIVLVDPTIELKDDSQCPCVVVLKRDEKALQRAKEENDFAEYKLRRAWIICSITDNIDSKLEKILSSPDFLSLKDKHGAHFLTNAEMIEDFKKYRMQKYDNDYPNCNDVTSPYHKVVISTTLHANPNTQHSATYNKVTFSIHPLILVQGIVEKTLRTQISKI
jgi:hypothetical protein